MGRVWSICRAAWKGHPLCHSHWALHFLSLVGSGCSAYVNAFLVLPLKKLNTDTVKISSEGSYVNDARDCAFSFGWEAHFSSSLAFQHSAQLHKTSGGYSQQDQQVPPTHNRLRQVMPASPKTQKTLPLISLFASLSCLANRKKRGVSRTRRNLDQSIFCLEVSIALG